MALMYSRQEFAGQLSSYAAEGRKYRYYVECVPDWVKRYADHGEWCMRPCNPRALRESKSSAPGDQRGLQAALAQRPHLGSARRRRALLAAFMESAFAFGRGRETFW